MLEPDPVDFFQSRCWFFLRRRSVDLGHFFVDRRLNFPLAELQGQLQDDVTHLFLADWNAWLVSL